MAQKFSIGYEGEWKISTPDKPTSFTNIVTPTFSPLPDNSVTFCFEAWHQLINSSIHLIKLKLVKHSSVLVPPTLEVSISVKVCYLDGSLFNDYETLPSKKVSDLKEITFDDQCRNSCDSLHSIKMRQAASMIIKCKMLFYDQDLASHFTTSIERSAPNESFDSMRNFKTKYDPNVFSDFVFKVGDKSLPAHKFVLVAHSPVFKNMLTHEFLETENNSATITDASPEIFDLFLKYLYSGEIEEKSWESIKALYYLADKYDVEVLKRDCTEVAISLLSVDIVCEIFQLAYTYNDADLKSATINYAVKHIRDIVSREDWNELVDINPKIGYEVTVNFIPK